MGRSGLLERGCPWNDFHWLLFFLLNHYHFLVNLSPQMLIIFTFAFYHIFSSIKFLLESLKRFVILYFDYFFVQNLLLQLLNVPFWYEGDVVNADGFWKFSWLNFEWFMGRLDHWDFIKGLVKYYCLYLVVLFKNLLKTVEQLYLLLARKFQPKDAVKLLFVLTLNFIHDKREIFSL